ncbi:MAG: CopD family protein [Bacteroidetes bacterium]|nr:CopD family protein [Bacteroidota bacterium]
MDYLLYIKALHIIFVVCWFAGLFYIVRLFIYQAEANAKTEEEKNILIPQYQLMQRRLWYGITWPSALLTALFGFWMYAVNFSYYLQQPWMMLKLFFVGVLFVYHFRCQIIFNKMKSNSYEGKPFRLRLFNEIATLLLFTIVFLVVVKSSGSLVWGGLGLVVLAGVIMLGTFVYKKNREKKQEVE